VSAASPPSGQAGGGSIFNVSVSGSSFNPSRGETVTLSYSLSNPATVVVKVFDPDGELVRVVADQARQVAGAQKVTWDGRDTDGRTVPNEAYFFTIEARAANGGETVYDPVTFSGGEPFDLGKAQVSREAGTLTYRLSQPSRVLLRIGVPGSALPETSVITIGNSATDYRTYKAPLGGKRASKPVRPMANGRKLSPQFMSRTATFRDFKIAIAFPEIDKGNAQTIPTLRDKVLVRIDIPAADREVIAGRQYEIILFADTTYFAEEERGYVPFNFPWELGRLPPGEHVLTVNIVTFEGQIGIGSRRIRVSR
jgi:hypothetical protein